MKAEEIQTKLRHFTGTENYYKHWTGLIHYTDGVHFIAEKCGAYWLLDLIVEHQRRVRDKCFQVWKLTTKDNKGVLTMKEDSGQPKLVRQGISYTDFPLGSIEFWLIDGVLILPSEY